MGVTNRHNLRYPEGSDSPAGHQQMRVLAEDTAKALDNVQTGGSLTAIESRLTKAEKRVSDMARRMMEWGPFIYSVRFKWDPGKTIKHHTLYTVQIVNLKRGKSYAVDSVPDNATTLLGFTPDVAYGTYGSAAGSTLMNYILYNAVDNGFMLGLYVNHIADIRLPSDGVARDYKLRISCSNPALRGGKKTIGVHSAAPASIGLTSYEPLPTDNPMIHVGQATGNDDGDIDITMP